MNKWWEQVIFCVFNKIQDPTCLKSWCRSISLNVEELYLKNPLDRGAWWATVHEAEESNMTEATWHSTVQRDLSISSRVLKLSICINHFCSPGLFFAKLKISRKLQNRYNKHQSPTTWNFNITFYCICFWRPCVLSCFSPVRLFVTLWTVACQAPLSVGFSRQEDWSGFHALLQGIFPIHGWNSHLLYLLHGWAGGSFTTSTTWEAFASGVFS